MNQTIRVVLADDHFFVRDGIKSLLESEKNIVVVGEATDGQEALEVVTTTNPDLLIVDIRMPHYTGIEVVEKLRNQNNPVKIIVLSMHESEEYVLKSIKAGADSYLIFRPALGEIMDEHLYDDLIEHIRIVALNVDGIIATEKCFIRKSGMKYHVDLHAVVDAQITVKRGHQQLRHKNCQKNLLSLL